MKELVLSPDVAENFPYSLQVQYDVLRSHKEELRTGIFGLRRRTVEVVDNIRITGITVTTIGAHTWHIPLGNEGSVGEAIE